MFLDELFKKKEPVFEPTLKIMLTPYATMYYATQAAKGEISGLGKVKKDKDGNFTLTEIIILKQTCSSAGTTLDKEALNDFLFKLAKQKKNPSEYNCWWHTHADFNVFWSTVDEENVKSLVAGRDLISIVLNKKGSILVRYDSKDVSLREIPYFIAPVNEKNIKKKVYREVKTKVKEKVFATTYDVQVPAYTKGDYAYCNFNNDYPTILESEKEDMKCTKCGWKGKEDFSVYICPVCGHDTLEPVIDMYKEEEYANGLHPSIRSNKRRKYSYKKGCFNRSWGD